MQRDYGARLASMRAAAGGKYFERQLETLHAAWEHDGIARIRKMPIPTVALRNRSGFGQPGRIVVASADPDFYGVVKGGRAVAMEAKRTERRLASMAVVHPGQKARGGIRWHQLQALQEVDRMGGVAAVVWQNGDACGVLLPGQFRNLTADVRSIHWTAFIKCAMEEWLTLAMYGGVREVQRE